MAVDHGNFASALQQIAGGGGEQRGDAFAAGTTCQADDLAARVADRLQAVGHLRDGRFGGALQTIVDRRPDDAIDLQKR